MKSTNLMHMPRKMLLQSKSFQAACLMILFLTVLPVIFVFSAVPVHAAQPVQLMIDEVAIPVDVPPEIVDGRTLVPARAVFEAMGGTVLWDDTVQPAQVHISCGRHNVTLTVGNATATVDGTPLTMDVPAQIINSRTLIPVRFVSESLNFTVRWDDVGRTVKIYSEGFSIPPLIATVSKFDLSASDNGTRLTITGSEDLSAHTHGPEGANRYFIEIENAALNAATDALEWHRELSVVHGVTAASSGDHKTRVTIALSETAVPTISFSEAKNEMYVDFARPVNPFTPLADGKLVVMLDPGHGAETSGKRSFDGTLMEYEFNRDVAAKMKAHLERHGVQVLTTTPDNTDVSLADRCRIANESEADIFVSVHANAFGSSWNDANGWEIYTYKKGSYSEQLANAIHRANIPANGLRDRGVKTERFYVIRNVNIPAVLIEHGFYSNQTEVELLKSAEFRETLARLNTQGILDFLGVVWTG